MTRSTAVPRRLLRFAAAALLGLVAVAGCKTPSDVVPIKTLLDDPTRFDGQVVRVAGDVGKAVGLLGYGAYQISDGPGTLNVVTKTGGAPREGAHVGVEGTFKALFTIGPTSGAALQETRRYTP